MSRKRGLSASNTSGCTGLGITTNGLYIPLVSCRNIENFKYRVAGNAERLGRLGNLIPTVGRERDSVDKTILSAATLRIARHHDAFDAGLRFARAHEVDIARHGRGKIQRAIDHLGIDIDRQHAVPRLRSATDGARTGDDAGQKLTG